MRYRMLGNTGLEVSEIGFGGWGIGGAHAAPAYGPTDDEESKLALRRAYELGINFYDTSDFYGNGHSETLIGDTLKDVRHQVILTTKVGLLDDESTQDFSPDHIRRSLAASLKRLQTDYIDLYQLHSPSIEMLREDNRILSTLESLVQEGKVRAFGVSVRSPDEGLAAVKEFGIQSIQVNFNLVDQRALTNGLLDLCEREGAGLIIRTPLCFGFLTGGYSPKSKFDATDHRSTWSSAQIGRWADAPSLFSSALITEEQQTPVQMALRYCLSYPSVSTAIPGMLKKEEVEENTGAIRMGPFPNPELRNLEEVYLNNTFFVGKGE